MGGLVTSTLLVLPAAYECLTRRDDDSTVTE